MGKETGPPVHVRIRVSISLQQHLIKGLATFSIPPKKEATIIIPLAVEVHKGKTRRIKLTPSPHPRRIEIYFSSTFLRKEPLGYIGKEGVFLPGDWCPKVVAPAVYKPSIRIPLGYQVSCLMRR
jgi:hypothetical protein